MERVQTTYTDENGYERGSLKHSNLIHRQIAYEEIYLKNRKKYSLPFSRYVIHHKDGDKQNNLIENLEILTPLEHELRHTIQIKSSGKIKKKGISFRKLLNFKVFHTILWASFFGFILGKFFPESLKLELIPVIVLSAFVSLIPYIILIGWWAEEIRNSFEK